MTKKIKRRITAIFLALVMVIGQMPAVSLIAHADATGSISLVATDHTFTAATVGYGDQADYQVKVRSDGAGDTGALNVTLGGSNPGAFELSTTSIASIPNGSTSSFKVNPKLGQNAGDYTATVTVSGDNVVSKSFNVSFTVSPAGTTFTAMISTNLDGLATDVTGDVELRSGSTTIAVSKSSTGSYEAAAPNGNYFIYVNGVDIGRSLTVSAGNTSVTLDYYTVNFSATYSGTATGCNIGASVDGSSISNGSIVLSGKTVNITASGTGASSYSYAWTGAGTSTETTATRSIELSNTVHAACVVTGSGTPIADPDYDINGQGYNWTGSAQTVALTGDNDKLTIHKAPTVSPEAIKIEVQSADGSNVTIDGNSIACFNTKVIVSNAITLNLKNLNIKAPTGDLQDWRLLTGILLKKTATINVTGTCTITGNANSTKPWYGYGLASDQDNTLRITGNGTLNVNGGNANTGNGGAGIDVLTYNYGTESGGKLIIEGGVTVNAKGGDSPDNVGGNAIFAEWGDVVVRQATVSAIGGNATGNAGSGGVGIQAVNNASKGGNVTITGSKVDLIGGTSKEFTGGYGIYASTDVTITDSTVAAKGGASTNSNGGIGIYASCDETITGGTVTATGGNGKTHGSHGIYSDNGTIMAKDSVNLTAVGGNGTTGMGGVGLRAYGSSNSVSSSPGMITILNNAGKVYIRGGQGATAQRASVMGKDVYIGTGNIGPIAMEGSTTPRSIKNVSGGDNLYLVNVQTNPSEEVDIQCAVNGTLGSYTYHAVADANGKACLWLPEGAKTLSTTGYENNSLTVATNDTSNTITLSKPSVVTAHDSTELNTYMAASNVTTINLVSGAAYTYNGTTVTRDLTINGNGATITVGTGFDDTIIKKEGNTVDGKVFIAVQNSGLTIKNVTLKDISTRILAVINVKAGGTLLLDEVKFEGFFANLGTDPYPTASNMPGSYNNFGVHAEPGAVSTTVQKCSFDSSNSFRNAIAIRKGIAIIKDNTFVGTATHDRQNQTDGFEYAVYLYGGTCTVTGNNMSEYDSVIKQLGYHSAGISICPYYSVTATITGNNLHDNARGLDIVGAWHTYSDPTDVTINGTLLKTSENAFPMGEALKAANTFSANSDGNIALMLDQNDNYIDSVTSIEYGPPAYFEPLLKVTGTSSTGATLGFDIGTWAQAMVKNAKSIIIQVSEDNGATWKEASITGTLNSSSTSVIVNLGAGKTVLLRSVITITANTRPLGSTDNVSADITCYSNTVSVTVPTPSSGGSSGGSGGGSTSSNTTGQGTVNVIVNGKTQNAGTETKSTENGKSTVTVAVNNKTIESKIDEAVKSNTTGQQNVIQVPVTDTKSQVVKVELTGDIVKQLETNTFDVSVKRDAVEYIIPAKELTISTVAKELGVAETSLKNIKVEVQIIKLDDTVVAKYNEVAKEKGAAIVFPPTSFEVVAKTTNATGKTEDVKISKFSNYVERVLEIPSGVDPSKITTGIVFNADGTYSHVPTDVYQSNGKWYAKLNSLTNSNYSVVWNPVTVKSVEKHWAKDAVNDMASRLVVFNAATFEPNKAITRADFAEYIVRALGIYRQGNYANKFKDVSATGDRALAVLIANEYGIVTGYEDGTFRGNNQITREEAMTMYQRAMKITKLSGSDTNRYQNYTDFGKVSNWATGYVKEVLAAHVFNGTSATSISPKSNLTYAESAQAIKNLLVESKLINK